MHCFNDLLLSPTPQPTHTHRASNKISRRALMWLQLPPCSGLHFRDVSPMPEGNRENHILNGNDNILITSSLWRWKRDILSASPAATAWRHWSRCINLSVCVNTARMPAIRRGSLEPGVSLHKTSTHIKCATPPFSSSSLELLLLFIRMRSLFLLFFICIEMASVTRYNF